MKPRIFISSVSSELASARQETANVLTRLGYDPVWQNVFGMEPGQLKAVLRAKIDDCEGLIHLVGRGYGAEAPEPDAEFGRVSYTQYEFLYAQARGKKTWIVFAEEGCTRDTPLEQLDLPIELAHVDATAYQAERRALQNAWRARLKGEGHLRHAAASDPELKLKVNELNEEFTQLRRGFRRWQKLVLGSSVAVLLLLAFVIAFQFWQKRDAELTKQVTEKKLEEIKANQQVTATRIKGHLEEASQTALREELAIADKEADLDKRERLKDAAKEVQATRMKRIGDLAERFSELEGQSEATEDFRELVRILRTEKERAVEKAIAYAEKGQASRFAKVRLRRQAEQERNRRELQTDLKAASLAATRGERVKARKLYAEIGDLEPDWPEALEAAGWFFRDEAWKISRHGVLRDSIPDMEQCFKTAERLLRINSADPQAQRLMSAAHNIRGEILLIRGQPGDMEQALNDFTSGLQLAEDRLKQMPTSSDATQHVLANTFSLSNLLIQRGRPGDFNQAVVGLTRGLELAESWRKRVPESEEAAEHVTFALNQIGDVLSQRGQAGDLEQVEKHFTRSLEVSESLHKRNPQSIRFARNTSISLNRLGDFLSQRGEHDDLEQAEKLSLRSVRISESLLKRRPESAEALRDLSVSLNKWADILVQRGQQGDLDQAAKHFERALQLSEALLKQNPESALSRRDVVITLVKMGDLFFGRGNSGDLDLALQYFARSLTECEEILKRNPDSSQAARDLTISLDRIGKVLSKRGQPGDFEHMLEHYTRSLEERERLSKRYPGWSLATHDVTVSLRLISNALMDRGQPADLTQAEIFLKRSLKLAEARYKQLPESQEAAFAVINDQSNLGSLQAMQNGFESALVQFQSALNILIHLEQKGAQVSQKYKAFLEDRVAWCKTAHESLGDWNTLLKSPASTLAGQLAIRAGVLARRGQINDSVQAAEKLQELAQSTEIGASPDQQAGLLFAAASAYGVCAAQVSQQSAISTGDFDKQKLIELTLKCLKAATEAGFMDYEHIRQSPDFTVLRGLAEFESIFPMSVPEKQ